MPDTLLMTRLVSVVAASLLLGSAAVTAQTPASADEEAPPAYVRRGDHVEATYEAYVERLGRYQTRLRRHLEADAPDLAATLTKTPPTPVEYGYLVVPSFSVTEPGAPATPRSNGYNWPWTNTMLDREQTKLAAAEQSLDTVDGKTEAERRAIYEQLTDGYGALERGQRLVDQHLKHNRFWQQVIAEDRDRFERQTVLHDAVVRREALRRSRGEAGITDETRADYDRQMAELDTQIEEGQPGPAAPGYIQITEHGPRRRVLRVPLYTDIPDTEFVAAAVQAIESAWSVDVDGIEYRLELDLRTLTPEELYRPDAPPARGTHIDVTEHVKRFPLDGGVLTTGANRTYAIPGRYVAVGPSPLVSRTMAHEFGHILGFTDRYLRGARDLGRAGFGILEIVPDSRDIMAAPASGLVRRSHFDTLIAAVQATAKP